MLEAIRFSETSVLTRATWSHVPTALCISHRLETQLGIRSICILGTLKSLLPLVPVIGLKDVGMFCFRACFVRLWCTVLPSPPLPQTPEHTHTHTLLWLLFLYR
jgi:hypothetical protein